MEPTIDSTQFGSITIGGELYDHDVLICLKGRVEPRDKELSSVIYGTSHVISLDEARHVYQDGAARLILGTGHYGLVTMSDEAADYLAQQGCRVDARPTPEAIEAWNAAEGTTIGLFHVTC